MDSQRVSSINDFSRTELLRTASSAPTMEQGAVETPLPNYYARACAFWQALLLN
jgi:hypothetical protein